MKPEIHFFIGKGGVGKSTLSALTALYFSGMGYSTLLASMDPAHNQRDIFEVRFSEKPQKICANLQIKEIDTDYWIARYLRETREHLSRTYLYESAFVLQNHFKVLQFSPGLEEYALLLAFENTLRQSPTHRVLIFDMAPTALTLRFFSLPRVTHIWLKELLKLRNLICEKKEIISRIRFGTCEMEGDPVKQKLNELMERHTRLNDIFYAQTTHIHLIMNEDRLSFSEAVRIQQRLADIGILIGHIAVNKAGAADLEAATSAAFKNQEISRFPLASDSMVGLGALQKYLRLNAESFLGLESPHRQVINAEQWSPDPA